MLNETRTKRLTMPGLADAVLGGLVYLYDSHVHNASNYSGSSLDYLISTREAKRFLPRFAAGFRRFLGKYMVRERHLQGTWPAHIHLLVNEKKTHASPLIVVADYNLMTTASTAFSLLLFEDRFLPRELRFVGSMLGNASGAIRGFRRDEAYNFWITHDNKHPSYSCSAPLNIPLSLVAFRRVLYKYARLFGLKNYSERLRLGRWVFACFDKQINPSGRAAVFNIPNDADNTSMAAGFQILYHQWLGKSCPSDDIRPLDLLALHRDLNRFITDQSSEFIAEETGTFLTWFRDEHLPIFTNPEKGIIPLGVNNVDLIINANALFALSLAKKTSYPGFAEAIRFIADLIIQKSWQHASHYYPENYVFPYALSRAWRDSGIRDPELDAVIPQLMVQTLDELGSPEGLLFKATHRRTAKPDGFVHQIALALITLLNLGRATAESQGLAEQYDGMVESAVQVILLDRKITKPRQKETHKLFTGLTMNFWDSGILYSSSLHQLAHWRSHAQTTALVLEAFAKYILAYDLFGNGFLSNRLNVKFEDQKWSLGLNDHPLCDSFRIRDH
ncbi:MAG TPA: hypothetical protein PK711_03705 [Bacteroidales bacterium]|nr:hypothetical protein [Bacteroidales bacterium]HRZ20532.1 hypothetical protein [Bacteroidales bacterium]